MSMKKIKTGLLLAILAALVFGMGSCDLFFGTSIEERIEAFNDDVAAGNLSRLYTHFHPDTVDRDTMVNTPVTYWDNTPFGSGNQIASYSISGDTVTGSLSISGTITVEMKKDGLDYMILSMTISGSGNDLTIRGIR